MIPIPLRLRSPFWAIYTAVVEAETEDADPQEDPPNDHDGKWNIRAVVMPRHSDGQDCNAIYSGCADFLPVIEENRNAHLVSPARL